MAKSKSQIRLGFFELLFGTDEGLLCIFTTDPKAPRTAVKQEFFQWPRESLKVENYILKQEATQNVYFCVNLLSSRQRKKQYCLPTNLVWADLDTASPEISLPPAVVVESSPGRYQAYWRMVHKLAPFDAERYSKRVAYAVGADTSGWDLTQLLRVPLTYNFKYTPKELVKLLTALSIEAEAELFEAFFSAMPEELPDIELPELKEAASAEDLIAKYRPRLDMDRFVSLFSYEPDVDADWSKLLWTLEVMCFRAGMGAEEVFIICQASSCNKYARDGRPIKDLWREVVKCAEAYGETVVDQALLEMPKLVNEPTGDTIIDEYKSWAAEATDAITEFHELSAFIVLSAIVSSSLRLETSWGTIAPNLWGLVLGDSTITRKSTSMKMAIDLLSSMEAELILATDGSVEGLLSGLATRPNKVSVFFRDEVSGLFDSINKRDYLNSMPETLAHLYDVPPVYSRLLRKEVIRIESPSFIFYGGGITDRVYQNVSEDWIESGFIPRFMIVSGEFDKGRLTPTGPPTTAATTKRGKLITRLADLYENYTAEVTTKIGNATMLMPPRIMAGMTPEAWQRYQSIESLMTVTGYESPVRNVALPTFDRMSRSILKMGMILAATRQEPVDSRVTVDESDIINAAYYAQKWGKHSVELILNAGKSVREKYIEKVYQKIATNPGILRSVLMQHMHMTKRETDEVISTLDERSMIRAERAGHASGNQGTRYWVT